MQETDLGSIRGLERSSRRGHSNPLQYSCLENPTDSGAWLATVHGVTKSWAFPKRVGHDLACMQAQDQRCTDRPLLSQKPSVCLPPCSMNHEVSHLTDGSRQSSHGALLTWIPSSSKCSDHYSVGCLAREGGASADTWGSLCAALNPPAPSTLFCEFSLPSSPWTLSSASSATRLHLGFSSLRCNLLMFIFL